MPRHHGLYSCMEMHTITVCSHVFQGEGRSPFINIRVPPVVTGLSLKRKIKQVLPIPRREQVLRWQGEDLESGDLIPDEATVLVLTQAMQECGMCGQPGGVLPGG